MKVGYLGPKGTFSYEVCKEYCKDDKAMVDYVTILDTIFAVKNNEVDEAIIPIENSLQGCVTDSIDALINSDDIFVIDELVLTIKQNLLVNKPCKLEEITKVYSHPQALAQCKKFLEKSKLYKKITSTESTASAAKKISESKETCACIANESCVKEYNLIMLQKEIQDNSYNKTRFWIISKNKNSNITKHKMSVLIWLKDKPGALYNALKVFNDYGLNLTKIESRPAKTVLGEYIFWIDIQTNGQEDNAIKEIKNKNITIKVLGSY